ncbi:response regulator [Gemmatimonas sp.]|uniref:response regulator n=1 Tax=Gemmatimonas sp. TaxID=1962908 RepID=UPI00286C183C|nr:response regulator [Gemmatimonas sp.]
MISQLYGPTRSAPLQVLIVDDELRVLDGMRRALYRVRDRWEIDTASGGEDALRKLSEKPADIVITDLRMPGMDGISLLETVAQSWPATVRMILSGQEDAATGTRATQVAHQYLSKPSDAEAVIAALGRATSAVHLLRDPAMRAMAGCLSSLPTTPKVLLKIQELTVNDGAAFGDLATLIAGDAALTAKLLQLVNSAYFGAARAVTKVEQAINVIGFQLLRALIISQEITHAFPCSWPSWSAEKEQQHAMLVGTVAQAMGDSQADRCDLFTAGVLHDVGMLVLASRAPTMLMTAMLHAERSGDAFHVAEAELHGVTHADVGAYLLGLWGLPWSLVEAVGMHHSPDAWRSASTTIPAKVAFAEQLVNAVHKPDGIAQASAEMLESELFVILGDVPTRERLLSRAVTALQKGGSRD